VDLDVLRAGGDGGRLDGIHRRSPHGVLHEVVLDLDPRPVRGGGIGCLEPLRVLDLGVEAVDAHARGVVRSPTSEIDVDEAARAEVRRAPSAQERLGAASAVDLDAHLDRHAS